MNYRGLGKIKFVGKVYKFNILHIIMLLEQDEPIPLSLKKKTPVTKIEIMGKAKTLSHCHLLGSLGTELEKESLRNVS